MAAVLFSTAAHAGTEPVYRPAPAWIVPAPPIDVAKLPADGSVLLLMDQQQRLEDGERWMYVESAMRAISAEMLGQMGTVTLPWHPAKGDLIIHRAEILRGSETIDLIAKGAKFSVLQREQQLERQALTGILSATMAIEGLRVNDIVRMSFSVTQKDPALGGRLETNAILLAEPMRVQFGRVRLIWPADQDLKLLTHATMPPVTPVKKGAYREVSVTLPLAKQPEIPTDAPRRYQHPPLIEASSFASWADVSKVAAPLYRTDGLIAPGSALAEEVAKIAAAERDPRGRAAAALRLVQDQVRYLFRGMDDGNYVPQSPARTWEVRYGDCKAKTLMLLALLHALDIKAEPVLANTMLGDWLPERLPSFGAFNHVLVRAEIDGATLWLDGTGSGSRIEDLNDTPPIYMALPARTEGAEFIAIAPRANARPDMVVDLDVDQSAGIAFPPSYKLAMTVRGTLVDMLRMTSAQAGENGIKDAVAALANGFTNTGSVVTRSVTFDDAKGTAHVEATGLANFHWQKEDERYQIVLDKVVGGVSFEPDRSRAAWQAIPVATSYLPSVRIRTRLRLPNSGAGFELQGDRSLDDTLAGLALGRVSTFDKGVISIEERVARRDLEIAANDITATRERVALAQTRLLKALAPADYPSRLQQIEAAQAAGRFEPILDLYRKGIEDDPDEADAYRNRASFFGGIYERRKAIADLDQVIKHSPDVETYLWRARLFNELGEKDKALADAESARKLEPASPEVIGRLALLREDRGEGDLALKLVDERIAVGGSDKQQFMALKAELLGKLGRVDEAVKILDSAITTRPGSPDLLNGRCWLKATRNVMLDTALKDCTKAIELAESPAAALDSRAMVYFRLGRLEDALADLEAAYAINQSNAGTMFMRSIIRMQTGDKGGAQDDLRSARVLSPRIDEEYAEFGIRP